jgi:hypothetical protein
VLRRVEEVEVELPRYQHDGAPWSVRLAQHRKLCLQPNGGFHPPQRNTKKRIKPPCTKISSPLNGAYRVEHPGFMDEGLRFSRDIRWARCRLRWMEKRVWMNRWKNTRIYRGSGRRGITPYTLFGYITLDCMWVGCEYVRVSITTLWNPERGSFPCPFIVQGQGLHVMHMQTSWDAPALSCCGYTTSYNAWVQSVRCYRCYNAISVGCGMV